MTARAVHDFIARGAGVTAHVAAIGVYCWPYVGEDGQEPRGTVVGLEVVAVGDGRTARALYHPDASLYGFVDQPDGEVRIHVRDPSGRFLERAATGSALGTGVRAQLTRGRVPPHPERDLDEFRASIVRVRMRPAPTSADLRLQTTLEGRILRKDGAPHVYARVALFATVTAAQDGKSALYVTHTDLDGRFVVWPRHVLAMPNMQRALRIWLAKEPPRPGDRDPLLRFPARFDALEPGTSDFDAVWKDGGVLSVELGHGERKRVLIQPPLILD